LKRIEQPWQGERLETPLSVPGRGWGRGFLPNPPAPFPERAGGSLRLPSPFRGGVGGGVIKKIFNAV